MWAHQYNQEPNQVECSLHRKPWVSDGPESNLYGLEPNFGCCTANFHQGWPKFAASLFLLSGAAGNGATETGSANSSSSQPDGLVAAAYAPCELRTLLNGTPVHIVEETNYPFHGAIHLTIHPAHALAFPLQLRIPAWASGATISVNGHPQPRPAAGTFAVIHRTWSPGDRVELIFPMQPRVSRWFHDSVAIERGPLVFSYGIGESWVKLRQRGMTADWQIFPTTPWNYALQLDSADPAKSIAVTESAVAEAPFSRRHAPVRLTVKARQLDAWRAVDGATNPLPPGPVSTDEPEQTLTLIPYAAAKLRITAFPLYKT